jgi:hypothetical protein
MRTRTSLLALAAVIAALAAGCSTPCGDLDEKCGDCPNTDKASVDVERACNDVIDTDDSDACTAALDSQLFVCPN